MNKRLILSFLSIMLLLGACAGKKAGKQDGSKTGSTLAYAECFDITNGGQYTTVTVFNPWKPGEVYDKYYLVKDENTSVPADGHKVRIPLKSLMTNSATHLGFLDLLGELDKVTGVCSPALIYNPTIRRRVEEGSVQDLGDAFNLDIERLLLLSPQGVMTAAYNADDENSRRIRQTGLTVLYNIEWQEKTLLGRAEWIKFVGAFFDKQAVADSIFAEVEAGYMQAKALTATLQEGKPTILSGQDFRGSWSMPGGKSFNAILFRDAGADYYYKGDSTSGSISTTIEEALVYFSKADFWVGVQPFSLKELGETDARYKLFKAYKEGNVYNTNRRMNASGGNDFWEGGVARPDLLLRDMIKILHPDLLPGYELTYMQKLTR